MAFLKHGSPVDIEIIKSGPIDEILCSGCNKILVNRECWSKVVVADKKLSIVCNECSEDKNV